MDKNVLTCIAVDDEPLALDLISEYASEIKELSLKKTFSDPEIAVQYVQDYPMDLVFLDIEMSVFSGLELASELSGKTQIIFTTAYEKYAVTAFDVKATDYLIKPLKFERFALSVKRALENKNDDNNLVPENKYIFIQCGHQIEKINIEAIIYIKGMRDYLQIVTCDKKYMSLLNFDKLYEKLPTGLFYRIHKSYMISLNHIQTVDANSVNLKNVTLPIGRTFKKSFFEALKNRG